MVRKSLVVFIAMIAFLLISIVAVTPRYAMAMTEAQAIDKMQKWVDKFSSRAEKIHKATAKCYKGARKDGESIVQHARRCRKGGEDRYDEELEKFTGAIKKLLRDVDGAASDKIMDELKDLHKCDRLMDRCKEGCGSDMNCVGHCCSEANKCDQKQHRDMQRILDKMD